MTSEKFITATIVAGVTQISPNDFRTDRASRNFAVSRSIADVLTWAEGMGIKNPTINDITFSDYTGSSI